MQRSDWSRARPSLRRYKGTSLRDAALQVRSLSGIDTLVEGSLVDDFMFEPCGYVECSTFS